MGDSRSAGASRVFEGARTASGASNAGRMDDRVLLSAA